MKNLSLTKESARVISEKLEKAGYVQHERKQYLRFSRERGDTTYIHHPFTIIRSTKSTVGESIIREAFGEPNGKASDSQDDRYSSWFFNGYTGKAGSSVY